VLSERGPRDRLWSIASRQRGYFTAAQALEAGYSYQAQRFHRQRGNWMRIDRGIYRFREYLDLPGQDTDHFVRWTLWSRGRAVVSHASALSVHDLGIANPAQVHLSVPRDFRQHSTAVALHRAEPAEDDIEQHEGFRVTTPVRAVVETAQSGADQDVIDSAVAELLDRGTTSRRRLLHAAQAIGPHAELAVERALRTLTS
jgi:predicted transcriptional regulator of viral defense system